MWSRNRLVNPVVRLLLRSPLHRLLSRSLVLLSYHGRKTGGWPACPACTPATAKPLGVRLETSGAVTVRRSLVVVTVHLDRS